MTDLSRTISKYSFLRIAFEKGLMVAPPDGRYAVFMWFSFAWRNLLEKTIKDGCGQNHVPVFVIRHKDLPCMDFDISLDKEARKVIFTYKNGIIIDELRYIEKVKMWLGRLFWSGTFVDYFWFVPVSNASEIDFDKIMKLLAKVA